MLDKIGEAGLVTVGKVIDGIRSGTAKSYVDYTRPSRVEPNLVIDSSLLFYEHAPVVTQSLHSAFSAYYLLSWTMMMATIDNIAVKRHMDKLNPNRSVKDSMLDSAGAIWMMSTEAYAHKLPSFDIVPTLEANGGRQGNTVNTVGYIEGLARKAAREGASEALANQSRIDEKTARTLMQESANLDKKNMDKSMGDAIAGLKKDLSKEAKEAQMERDLMMPSGITKNSLDVIKEASNMSVGKILEVEISNSGQKHILPIMVRLNANVLIPGLVSELLSTGNVDNSVSTRWTKMRSGQINFLDLMTARDLNKRHKKNLMQDKSGVYTALSQQQRNNKLSGILSMNPTVATMTNLVVTTTETIKKVELEVGGSFDDFRTRQKLFDATGLFIVAVVDMEYDRIKFYTTDIAQSSNLSIRECAASNKKEGASITDILKAYQLGNAPGF